MQEIEIIEGNKLIAEFMGGVLKHESIYSDPKYSFYDFGDNKVIPFDKLKYHKDIKQQMTVVEKIEHTSVDGQTLPRVTIDTTFVRIWHQEPPIEHHVFDTKEQALFNAMVEFIKWYNQNKPYDKR